MTNPNDNKNLCGLCFWASYPLIDRFYLNLSIKGRQSKNKGHINFYECCDLTKKVYLNCTSRWPRPSFCLHYKWSFYNCFLLLFVGVLLFHTLKETLNWHFLLYMMAMEGLELPITLRITYTNLSWTNLNTKKGTWRNQRSKLSCK